MNVVYHPNIIRNWSSLPNLLVPPPQGRVPDQNNYDQQMTLYRSISNHPIMRFTATSSEVATLAVEAAESSRQPRPMSIGGHSGNVTGGRARNFYNTFHSLFNEANPHNRWVSEVGFIICQTNNLPCYVICNMGITFFIAGYCYDRPANIL